MHTNELKAIIRKGESLRLEFKSNFNHETIITVTAFANTKGGRVIIGVSDKGEIIGVDIKDESLNNWINEIKQKTSPSIIPDAITVNIENKTVVVMSAQEFPVKPVSSMGRYYSRKNNSNHQLTTDEIVETRFISLNQSYDSFLVERSIDDFDKNALELFQTRINQSGRFKPSDNRMVDFEKLGFFKGGKPTRAAELLFGTHFTGIHIGRFKSASTIIDDIVIRTPLVIAIEEAMDFIKKNIALGYEFSGELQRKNRWQYPLQAIRELLLNAIVHKDYRNPTDVIIKIFDDRIEFSSPGGLIGNLTVEVLRTDSYQARHRNRLLAEAFYLMGEVEKYGTGFIRIRDWLHEYPELSFEIIDLNDFLRTVITNQNKVTDKVTDNQKAILKIMKANNRTTTFELSKIIGISQRKTKENIRKLKELGLLRRIGPPKGGHWKVNEN